MAKMMALIALGLVTVGGGAYGLYAYTDVFVSSCEMGSCEVTRSGCCGGQSQCVENEDTDLTAAVALAGPAGVVHQVTPVAAVQMPCCSAKISDTTASAETK